MEQKNRVYERGWIIVLACVAVLAFWMVFRLSIAGRGVEGPAQQEVLRLETRINQLETRLYSMESTLRSIEQQSRLGTTSSQNVSPQELALLTSTIQTLQLRLNDDECALAKLDERTLTPAMRAARQKASGLRTDPCRLSADTPLRLPERRE